MSIIENDSDIDSDKEKYISAPTFDLTQLPESFKTFLNDNDINPKIYTIFQLPRYIRWNTHLKKDQLPSLDQLKTQLKTDKVWKVKGMNGFFGFILDDNQRLIDIPAYKNQQVFGIDISSAIAVEALNITQNDHILDLCCAPGAKLCMIANIIGVEGTGTVTGVDVASHRLATCRSLVKKYKVGTRVRLYDADGTTFDIPAPSRLGSIVLNNDDDSNDNAQKEKNDLHKGKNKEKKNDDNSKSLNNESNDDQLVLRKKRKLNERKKPFWAPKLLRFDQPTATYQLYDKILVDAECTHDGSISHIIKYEKWGWEKFEKNFMDINRLNTICDLQRRLMDRGWSLLKKNGYMVYSTCSLTIKQNEENVAWFLEKHKDAILEPIPIINHIDVRLAKIKYSTNNKNIQDRMNKFCIRFDPLISNTSGFFLAKFKKSSSPFTE
ncbi:S-adenosyl-L-methionine-dependent methyltransferase [Cunninghamella echinulata]|nr:S-adenosyl-L-methionine-dependent methyltransferase [Cunninghamella echinulata]